MDTYDVIILGLGAMGSAAAHHLARRGARVLGLEQFALVHDRGSSHGETRICRKAYFEHPDYVPLLHRAYALWSELETQTATRLFERCGLLLCGRPDGEVIPGVRRAAREHSLAIEEVARATAAERFPGFRIPSDFDVLFETDAGYLRVEACVRAQLDAARLAGAALREREAVLRWSADARGVAVETGAGQYTAARLVITAGPWAGRILSDLSLPLVVTRKVQLWFATGDPRYTPERGAPAFCFDTADGFCYGFPVVTPGRVKVAEHTGREAVLDPARVERALLPADAPRVQTFVTQHLPGVRPDVIDHSVCMYTMSPDAHFIIDRHPQHENVVFAAGFSGHGFKFAPLVGSVLADLALDGRTREPVEFLSSKRLARAAARASPESPTVQSE